MPHDEDGEDGESILALEMERADREAAALERYKAAARELEAADAAKRVAATEFLAAQTAWLQLVAPTKAG